MKTTLTSAAIQLIRNDWARLFCFCLVAIASTCTINQTALAQDDEEEPLVVQVYDVSEFVTPKDDHPFDGFVIPGISTDQSIGFIGGSYNGGGVISGGSSAGGVFNIPPSSPRQFGGPGRTSGPTYGTRNATSPSQLTTDSFAEIIMESVAADSWRSSGSGLGTIMFMGTTMIVSQTPTIHSQIETLLKMLAQTKASSKNRSVVTINAIWLTIDETQFSTLALQSDRSVDEDALKKLTEEFGKRGQITCFDDQRVHVAAGNLKSSVESVIPVVGQNELPGESVRELAKTNPLSQLPENVMAQASNSKLLDIAGGDGEAPPRVGYKPVARWTNYGTVLQVRPRVETDQQIWLDVSSIVVQPGETAAKMKMGQVEIDKHNMHCQQFRTSIRVNDSTPTLVGGSAFGIDSENKLQTYLILEASKIVKPTK